MKSSSFSPHLPQSLRWAKWVVKCPCSELNKAYKIYMVCKEVLYITPLMSTGEKMRQHKRKRERQNKAMINDSDVSGNRWKESFVLMHYFVHLVMSLCLFVFSQLLAFLYYIALKLTLRNKIISPDSNFILILLYVSEWCL